MSVAKISAIAAAAFQVTSALAQTPATSTVITGDPTERFSGIFDLGSHTCQQIDDTGRPHIFFEGMPNLTIMIWLQISDGGTKPGVPVPEDCGPSCRTFRDALRTHIMRQQPARPPSTAPTFRKATLSGTRL
jgi:hypothetical protein